MVLAWQARSGWVRPGKVVYVKVVRGLAGKDRQVEDSCGLVRYGLFWPGRRGRAGWNMVCQGQAR